MTSQFTSFSFRDDPNVPAFEDQRPLIVYDGDCVLCSGFAAFILRHDRQEQFLFTAAQSPLGDALYAHYGLPRDNYTTNIVIREGVPHFQLDAFFTAMTTLGWPWKALTVGRILPAFLQDWLYSLIARNRYRFFGKHDTCMLIVREQAHRFLT